MVPEESRLSPQGIVSLPNEGPPTPSSDGLDDFLD